MLGARPEGLPESVFVHPLAFVESATVGEGTRVWPFAHVMKGAKVGAGCNLGEHAFVEAGAVVGDGVTVKNGVSIWDKVIVEDDVFLGPHCVLTNHLRPRAFIKEGPEAFSETRIERGATIGAGAVLVCGTTIGRYAFVAAGAVVTKDVPPHALVMGNPARVTATVCSCLKTRYAAEDEPTPCASCGLPGTDELNELLSRP